MIVVTDLVPVQEIEKKVVVLHEYWLTMISDVGKILKRWEIGQGRRNRDEENEEKQKRRGKKIEEWLN